LRRRAPAESIAAVSLDRLHQDDEAREPARPEPAPARPALPAERLLELQRTAGNAAVSRALLQRNGPAVAVKTPEQECEDAVKAEDWPKVAQLLTDNRPGIIGWFTSFLWTPWVQVKLAKLTPDQLRYLDDAARRSAIADAWLRTAIKAQLTAKTGAAARAEPGMGYGVVEGKVTLQEHGDVTSAPKKPFKFRFETTFTPLAAAVDADEIAFIQTVRNVSSTSGANTSPYGTKRMTPDHSKVDRLTGREQGWYGMNDNETGGATLRPWVKGSADPAWTRDTPSAVDTNEDWHFETAVVCRKGADAGKVYAVITWGFTIDDKLKITPKAHKVWNKPTDEFMKSVEAWNTQASGPEADRNAPGQKPLPTPT
jgi:hypothetical protein